MSIEVRPKNLGSKLSGRLRRMGKKYEVAAVRGMRSAAMRGVGIVQENISKASPFPAENTGELKRSVGYDRLPDGGRVKVDAPHAPFMEEGTRPHRPPIGPLVTWAARKFRVSEKEAWAIARSVQKKIEKDGIEPRHFMKNSIPEIEKVMMREILKEIRRVK